MTNLNGAWKKSSRSGTGNCVEVRRTDDGVIQVRDSKHPYGAVLSFAPAEWDAFITDIKAREFPV